MPNAVYQVQLSNRAKKALVKLPTGVYERIAETLRSLQEQPRPAGCKKLKGRDGYRVRVGDYRIVYDIVDDKLLVLVIDIGHRRDIYH